MTVWGGIHSSGAGLCQVGDYVLCCMHQCPISSRERGASQLLGSNFGVERWEGCNHHALSAHLFRSSARPCPAPSIRSLDPCASSPGSPGLWELDLRKQIHAEKCRVNSLQRWWRGWRGDQGSLLQTGGRGRRAILEFWAASISYAVQSLMHVSPIASHATAEVDWSRWFRTKKKPHKGQRHVYCYCAVGVTIACRRLKIKKTGARSPLPVLPAREAATLWRPSTFNEH